MFVNWKNFVASAEDHGKAKYHQDAIGTANSVEDVLSRRKRVVDEMLDHEHRKRRQVVYNGAESIAKAVILCGVQGISLRGHHDDYVVDPGTNYFEGRRKNVENFNSLLHLQCQSEDL